jgi:drug/metabolite transporter (DMT)-like permease
MVTLSPVLLKNFYLNSRHLIATALGFSGAFLVVTGGRLSFTTEGLWGYILAVLAALTWSSYSLLLKRVKPFPTGAVGLFCLISGLLSIIGHLLLEPPYAFSGDEILPLLYLGLGPMGAAFYTWDRALKLGDPRVIGSLAFITPLLSTLLLIGNGHGQMTWAVSVATFLIISGAVVGARANTTKNASGIGIKQS